MAKHLLGGMEIEVDEDGFIQEPEKWNKAIAEDLAKEEGAFPMGEDAWKLVNFLREYFLTYEIAPPVRVLTRKTGLSLECIYKLFPKGPAAGACKVAGLPKPTGCI